jgi:truncated hemoglobin YjbI
MASRHPPDLAPPARWRPCEHACRTTLRWPVRPPEDAGATRAGPALPEPEAPAHSLLALCGEAGLRRLVHRHMARLRLTPLLDKADPCFECVAERVGDFVVESCGGPLYYSERHARLRAGAGWPVLLDEAGREIWLVQLWHSFDDVGLAPPLRAAFWAWAEPLSLHLLAPRARHAAVQRYPWATVAAWFQPPAPRPPVN